ncbi:MAG: hypothetical protein HY308_19515 [Gammaproteobacteria bacterium]|nr:hypothetical protein [Gammaproteobacteria bacterium]
MELVINKAYEIAKDALTEILLERAKRAVDENTAIGPQALEHVRKDIEALEKEVEDYEIRFEMAKEAVQRGKLDMSTYVHTCVTTFASSESKGIDKLIKIIEEISGTSTKLEEEAQARISKQTQQLRDRLKKRARE